MSLHDGKTVGKNPVELGTCSCMCMRHLSLRPCDCNFEKRCIHEKLRNLARDLLDPVKRRVAAMRSRCRLAAVLVMMSSAVRAEDASRGAGGVFDSSDELPLTTEEVQEAFHDVPVVMAEVQRLQELELTDAVGAIVEGTTKVAVGHMPSSDVLQQLAAKFASAMKGVDFFTIDDSQRPENQRFRKAMYVAACASLARAARTRAESMEEKEEL